MSRPLLLMGAGLLVTALMVLAITPVAVFELGVVAPMLGIIAVGVVVVVIAGVRGQRAEEARDLRQRSRDVAGGDAAGPDDNPLNLDL
jgi:FtsH-binding integral membrane protein